MLDSSTNLGNEFINLSSKFKDRSTISFIHASFEDNETPIICYKYTKLIRTSFFNLKKNIVANFGIETKILDF